MGMGQWHFCGLSRRARVMGEGRDVRAGVDDHHGSLVSRICWAGGGTTKYDLSPNVVVPSPP
jgi:hypothetical protein